MLQACLSRTKVMKSGIVVMTSYVLIIGWYERTLDTFVHKSGFITLPENRIFSTY